MEKTLEKCSVCNTVAMVRTFPNGKKSCSSCDRERLRKMRAMKPEEVTAYIETTTGFSPEQQLANLYRGLYSDD